MFCNHANECPAECQCKEDCYCRVHGSCSGRFRTAEDVRRHQTNAAPQWSSRELIDIYVVYNESEHGWGGGPCGYFTSFSAAKEFGRNKGSWGGPVDPKTEKAIRLQDGTVYRLADPDPIDLDGVQAQYEENLRKQAIAKLTDEERRVLGLVDKK